MAKYPIIIHVDSTSQKTNKKNVVESEHKILGFSHPKNLDTPDLLYILLAAAGALSKVIIKDGDYADRDVKVANLVDNFLKYVALEGDFTVENNVK